MASIIIRDALISDIDTIHDIELSAAKKFATVDNAEIKAIAAAEKTLDTDILANAINNGLCFISEIEQKPVGFIAVTQYENSWYIEELSVVEHAQSQGVGNGLLVYIKMLAEIKRIPSINLITFRNIAWNQDFYTKKSYLSMSEDRLSDKFLELWHEDNQQFPPKLRVCMQLKIDIDKF